MKLLKTIKRLVEEAERNYISACEGYTNLEEIERLEKNYKNSLKLLEMVKKEKITDSEKRKS